MVESLNPEIISSYNTFESPSYEEYVFKKGHPLLVLKNLDNTNIKKENSTLTINGRKFNISNLTLGQLLNLIAGELPLIKIGVVSYLEDMSYLYSSMSCKFLADFNSKTFIRKRIIKSPINKDNLERLYSKIGCEYILESYYATDLLNKVILPSTETSKEIVIPANSLSGYLHLTYTANTLVVYVLPEHPITDITDLYTFGQ